MEGTQGILLSTPRSSAVPKGCIPFQECRAKTCPDGSFGTFVYDHCRYAGYVAEALLALLPPSLRRLLPLEAPFLVALHDIGKVSPGFEGKYFLSLLQSVAPEWALAIENGGIDTDHAKVGARALQRLFGLDSEHPVVRAVASHHGFMPERLFSTKDGAWQDERAALVRALATEFGTVPDSAASANPDAALLAGLTCVSDWIASDEEIFPPNEPPLSPEEGRARAAKAVTACGFTQAVFRHGLSFRDIFGFDPYPAQTAFLETVSAPGVYVLEAPMGMGKTEAALYAAYHLIERGLHSGLYFALPTRLTSDRIHERVRSFLEAVAADRTAVKLAHGQAWLKEFESGAEGSDQSAGARPPPWFNPSKRGLLFPFAVGTIDQALLAVLNVKHSFVRSFGLAGKVVVLDEVHSYDAYTGALLDELVARIRNLGCTVIVLSATLTAARRAALLGPGAPAADAYPLLAGIRADGTSVVQALEPPPSRTVRLRWMDASVESPLAEAVAKARAGCNVLCIANTVATAQEWFRALKAEMAPDEFPVGLLHAKFTGADRERIENEWMEKLGKPPKEGHDPRPRGSILVATQIVEQSVDIDADWMLSELAPVDMLLQRLGRLWRHNRPNRPIGEPELAFVCAKMPPPDLASLIPDSKALEEFFGRGVWVYAPYVLLRTLETLRPLPSLRVPDDIRSLLETVYADLPPSTPLHRDLLKALEARRDALRQRALSAQSDALPGRLDDDEHAGTRYDTRPSVSLLILRDFDPAATRFDTSASLLDGTRISISRFRRDFSVTRALHENLVRTSPTRLLAAEPLETDLLAKHFLPSDMPIVCLWDLASGALRLHASGQDAGHAYHPLFGLWRTNASQTATPPSPSPSDGSDLPDLPDKPPLPSPLPEPEGDFIFDNDNDW